MYHFFRKNTSIVFLFLILIKENAATDFEPRITNGMEATHDQFPWQVLLQFTGDMSGWQCGGSVIDDEWILTAAHCIENAISVWISGIESDFLNFISYVHEDYDGIANDISLLNFVNSSDITNFKPIALLSERLEAGVEIVVSGYGQTSDNSSMPTSLHYANLTTIENSDCDAAYGGGIIKDDMLCAVTTTNLPRGTCFGDSGGPAVIYDNGVPILTGVITFVSDRGCEMGDPSGFERISYHREWIRSKSEV